MTIAAVRFGVLVFGFGVFGGIMPIHFLPRPMT